MTTAIHDDNGRDAHGERVSSGYYAISPDGHLIKLPVKSPIKDGWRLATQQDIEAKQKLAGALDATDSPEAAHIKAQVADGEKKSAAKKGDR
jgi:hypothetical protein